MARVCWHRGCLFPSTSVPGRAQGRDGDHGWGGGTMAGESWGLWTKRNGDPDKEGWGPWTKRTGDPEQGEMGTLDKEAQPSITIAGCMMGNCSPILVRAVAGSPNVTVTPPGWPGSAAQPPPHPPVSPHVSPFPSKVSALIT